MLETSYVVVFVVLLLLLVAVFVVVLLVVVVVVVSVVGGSYIYLLTRTIFLSAALLQRAQNFLWCINYSLSRSCLATTVLKLLLPLSLSLEMRFKIFTIDEYLPS